MASADPAVVARAIQCLASTVENGAVNVNVLIVDAVSGTSTFDGGTANNGDVIIPQDWSSFTVTNHVDSASSITVGGVSIPPGLSISHGTWKQFPGDPITVTSPDADTTATVTWIIETPNP